MDGHGKIGRLAFRHEGKMWNAYYMLPNSAESKIFLGSILMSRIEISEDRRNGFVALMREVVADTIEETVGVRPTWGGEEAAPEHERAGHG